VLNLAGADILEVTVRASVVVVGNFDGVHRGHQQLLARAKELAVTTSQELSEEIPLPLIALTFWPHPLSVLNPTAMPKLLTDLSSRISLLRQYGADQVRVIPFNRQIADWSPEHFVESILIPLNPTLVVVGENFSYGRQAAGNVASLRLDGRFKVAGIVLQGQQVNDSEAAVSSSSLIREALDSADVELANEHLGRLFRVRGLVVTGDQRGRTIGFPTANVAAPADLMVPADGVYAGWLTRLDVPAGAAEPLPAAISVGTNPTFDGLDRRVEAHVIGRDDLELYGVEVGIDFVKQLRPMVKFPNITELVAQMNRDVAAAREILGL
jgi:riboflavin kinase/FMN adenylyltransferase